LWVSSLAGFDDGSGPALYAGGSFTIAGGVPAQRIARWRSTGWSQVGLGLDSSVYALAVFDDGTTDSLYAGGLFVTAGGTPANRIARWNGTSWSPLGAGVTGGTTGHCECLSIVECLVAFDDGTGPALYAGGNFTIAGGTSALNVARWNGTSWSAVGAGLGPTVRALAVFDDGTGPALFAAGSFAGGLVKWTGTSWSTFGANPNWPVNVLQVFDAGSGPALYVGGEFTSIGGIPAQHVARWDGTTWSALGAGVGTGLSSDDVDAFAVFDDGSGGGPDLYVGGQFSSAGGVKSSNLASWMDFEEPGEVLCTGDGISGPCPCANFGAPGHGCENSASTGGARLFSSGSTSPDTVLLHASGELPTALSIFLQGTNVAPPAPFGDGLRCASGILKRLYVKAAVAGTASAPGPGDPPISLRSAQLGDTIHPGDRRYYQVYYRDPDLAFCADPLGGTFNVTNGVKLVW
jgi:hypothetical protein